MPDSDERLRFPERVRNAALSTATPCGPGPFSALQRGTREENALPSLSRAGSSRLAAAGGKLGAQSYPAPPAPRRPPVGLLRRPLGRSAGRPADALPPNLGQRPCQSKTRPEERRFCGGAPSACSTEHGVPDGGGGSSALRRAASDRIGRSRCHPASRCLRRRRPLPAASLVSRGARRQKRRTGRQRAASAPAAPAHRDATSDGRGRPPGSRRAAFYEPAIMSADGQRLTASADRAARSTGGGGR